MRAAERLPDRPARAGRRALRRPRGRAARRLAFDELLLDQLVLLRRRAGAAPSGARASAGRAARRCSARWRDELLPFAPTGDQRARDGRVDADLARERPMQRLLMGEVGSGKTVVALHAMLRAVEHGDQAALMAPTETLAEQHFATLQALMPGAPVPAALLTGSTPAARRARTCSASWRAASCRSIVGTHALIEDDVAFAPLAVAVVDEQHRFGVRQRARARRQGAGRAWRRTCCT